MTIAGITPAPTRSLPLLGDMPSRLLSAFVDLVEPLIARLVRERRWIAVELEDDDFAFYRVKGGRTVFFGDGGALTEKQRRAMASGSGGPVELRLRPGSVMTTTFDLPAGGRDYVAEIVGHRLDRLTPWMPDRLVYGFIDTPRPGGKGIDIHFAATSQEIAAAAIGRLERFGLVPTVLGASEPAERPLRIDLFRGRNDRNRLVRRRRIAVVTVVLVGLLLAGAIGTGYARSASSARLAAIDQQVAAARRTLVEGTGDAAERQSALTLIDAKQPADAVFVLIDRLARAIPQTTYLDELEIGPTSMRLTGRSTEASTLIEILDAERSLDDVRFAAPVTREDDGRDRFDITVARGAGQKAEQ